MSALDMSNLNSTVGTFSTSRNSVWKENKPSQICMLQRNYKTGTFWCSLLWFIHQNSQTVQLQIINSVWCPILWNDSQIVQISAKVYYIIFNHQKLIFSILSMGIILTREYRMSRVVLAWVSYTLCSNWPSMPWNVQDVFF